MLPPTDDRFLGNMLRSQGPRFESSMMDMPSSNAQVHGHSSVGTPYLSVSSPMRSPTEAKKAAAIAAGTSNDDKDEAQLLADILDPSDQRRRRAVTEGQTATSDKVVRPLINRNVGAKSFSLPKDALQDGLKHLVLFPRSFTSDSALFVMGLNTSMQGESEASNMALQPLVDMQLLRKLDSARYVVSDLTKGLIAGQPYDEEGNRGARQRYVSYYMEKLRRLDNQLPGASGKERLDAMKVYDVERENVQEGLEICREMGGKCMMIEFLSVAATLMRYSTTAKERVDVFGEVVASLDRSGSPERASMNAEARVRLALGEAYFDLLEFDSAEEHLGRAIASMAGGEGRSLPVSTSVLALMLLAELKIRGGEHEEARKLLIQALKSLKEGSLAKSAFAVCCLLNLASTYALSNQLDEAGRSVNAGLEVLTERGFTHMPIYADALGTIGSVHAQRGRWEEAQQLFLSGLNEVQAWMAAKGWERAPIQHCAHLHILLVESIAQTYRAQERHEDAARLAARAREQRKQRGLRERAEGRRGVEWSLGRHLY